MENDVEARVLAEIRRLGVAHELVRCDESEADTAEFCARRGYPVAMAANAIIVASKKDPRVVACCLVLGTHRLDVNGRVRQVLAAPKLSFANAEDMRVLTGMQVGGVTPFALPPGLPILICRSVLDAPQVIVGTGGRTSKLILAPAALVQLPGAEVHECLSQLRSD